MSRLKKLDWNALITLAAFASGTVLICLGHKVEGMVPIAGALAWWAPRPPAPPAQ